MNAEVREYYILQELDNIIRNQWLYQLDKVISSVENIGDNSSGKRAIDRIQKAVSGFDGIRRKSGREESGKYFV